MDHKAKAKTKAQALTVRYSEVAGVILHLGAALVFSGGSIMSGAYPFAVSLASAATGTLFSLAATVGGIFGTLRFDGSVGYAAVLPMIFLARLIVGRWLSPPERRDELPDVARLPRHRLVWLSLMRLVSESFEVSFKEPVGIRMALASVGAMLGGAVMCADADFGMEYIIGAVVAGVSAPALVLLFTSALSPSEGTPEILKEAGSLALSATAVLSLSGLFPHFDASVVAAFVITLLTCRSRGMLTGTLYGVVCGVVLTPTLAPMYALAAIVSGALWRVSQTAAVSAACFTAVVWGIYVSGLSAMSSVTPELIITSAVLAPLCSSGVIPRGVRCADSVKGDEISSFVLRGDETARRMRSLSVSIKDISGVLGRLSDRLTMPDTDELCRICDDAFEESCSRCSMKSACFGRELKQTSEMQARMTLQLKNDGRVSAAAVSQHMAKRCTSIGDIIDRMNGECARRISEMKLYDRTAVVAEDYEVMAELLREASEYDAAEYRCDRALTDRLRVGLRGLPFSADSIAVFGDRVKKVVARGVSVNATSLGGDDICGLFSRALGTALSAPEFELDGSRLTMRLDSKPRLAVRCGRASVALSELGKKLRGYEDDLAGEATRVFIPGGGRAGLGKTSSEQCGDVISAFLTDDSRFFMLISDGMGSGKEAALTSGVCAVFLEKMLKAGASMDTSLKMLNSMMRVREGECSATVDLMELDLMNGGTRFVKSGAAPSFVLRGGRLFRLQSKTVPIGIVRALDAEMIKFETEPGDIIVMLSDGVARSFEDCPWLYDLLCDESEWVDDPERMARKIIKCAVKNGAEDDITAGVVIIE